MRSGGQRLKRVAPPFVLSKRKNCPPPRFPSGKTRRGPPVPLSRAASRKPKAEKTNPCRACARRKFSFPHLCRLYPQADRHPRKTTPKGGRLSVGKQQNVPQPAFTVWERACVTTPAPAVSDRLTDLQETSSHPLRETTETARIAAMPSPQAVVIKASPRRAQEGGLTKLSFLIRPERCAGQHAPLHPERVPFAERSAQERARFALGARGLSPDTIKGFSIKR